MIHRVKCKSGIVGYKCRLRDDYDNCYEQFATYCRVLGIAERLGYDSIQKAWDDNLIIEGSIVPSDLRVSPIQNFSDCEKDTPVY